MVKIQHYYGDVVRRLFIVGSFVMLLTLPIFNSLIPVHVFFSILAIIIVSTIAGMMNPIHKTMAVIEFFVSIIALLIFEYFAVEYFVSLGQNHPLFFINQGLAILFFVALYFSSKTLRGILMETSNRRFMD